jgi:hypothetical protein
MMTDEERFKFWQEWKGKKIECWINEGYIKEIGILEQLILDEIESESRFKVKIGSSITMARFARPIQKKERLMTLEELDGKWITWCDQEELHKIRIVFRNGFFSFGHRSFGTVKKLHEKGGVWNDKPSFEGLKSLMVEVSE